MPGRVFVIRGDRSSCRTRAYIRHLARTIPAHLHTRHRARRDPPLTEFAQPVPRLAAVRRAHPRTTVLRVELMSL